MGLAMAYNRDATVGVTYEAPAEIGPVAGASAVKVHLTAMDGRTTDPKRIGVLRDVFGIPMGVISVANDIPETARIAVEQNLKAQGFWINPEGLNAQVEVLRFSADFPIRGFGWGVAATAELRMSVRTRDGATVFTKVYDGAASELDSSRANIALSNALTNCVSVMVNDKDFQVALLTAQKS